MSQVFMDDDFTFGASVWGAPSEPEPWRAASPPKDAFFAATTSSSASGENHFDEFEEFGLPTGRIPVDISGEDDFGDFGDFGEADGAAAPADFGEEVEFGEEVRIAGPSSHEHWQPLSLDPMPSRSELRDQVRKILAPVWEDNDIAAVTTNDEIREVEGISQILVSPESRDLYNTLFHAPPPIKPPNWTRSRIRRLHLIALGIPVNLDEILPNANGKPLPPLQITTRPMSAPPGPRNLPNSNHLTTSASTSRPTTPHSGQRPDQSLFGPKPELDEAKILELLNLETDNLTLLPISKLDRHLADMRAQTAATSALLTHLLQSREALQQDSETYNKLIAELVGEAQKQKTGKSVRTPGRRGSGMT